MRAEYDDSATDDDSGTDDDNATDLLHSLRLLLLTFDFTHLMSVSAKL